MEDDSKPNDGNPNPKDAYGKAKPGLSAIPPSALIHLGAAMADGAGKYGLFNFRRTKIEALVYYDAAMRHLLKWRDREQYDSDSAVSHLGHVMACCAILIDAELQGKLIDNRGEAGKVSQLIDEMTTKKADGPPPFRPARKVEDDPKAKPASPPPGASPYDWSSNRKIWVAGSEYVWRGAKFGWAATGNYSVLPPLTNPPRYGDPPSSSLLLSGAFPDKSP